MFVSITCAIYTFCFLDYIVVGSDSGKITILEYNSAKNVLDKVHMETFGKSGCRRIVPGQYLAIDPKGRAVMIGNCRNIIFMVDIFKTQE